MIGTAVPSASSSGVLLSGEVKRVSPIVFSGLDQLGDTTEPLYTHFGM